MVIEMIIIKIEPESNGAHKNQIGNIAVIPEGWAQVAPEIEAEARGYLPFINIDAIEGGLITAVSQGVIPEPEPEPPPPPTPEEQIAELQMQNQILAETLDTLMVEILPMLMP